MVQIVSLFKVFLALYCMLNGIVGGRKADTSVVSGKASRVLQTRQLATWLLVGLKIVERNVDKC